MNALSQPGEIDHEPSLGVERVEGGLRVIAAGEWVAKHAGPLDARVSEVLGETADGIVVDLRAVTRMDTAGAWLIERLQLHAERNGVPFRTEGGTREQQRLFEAVSLDGQISEGARQTAPALERFGRSLVGLGNDFLLAMHVLGAAIRGPQSQGTGTRFRLTSVVHQLDQMGLRAVPVIALMNFLVGGIVAQQAAFQLKYYGEEILTASLVGLLVLREVGVLLTAILVAGRSGSAITAELGTMKMREETDALTVMGLNPIGVLIFPRLLALVIAMPLLTIVANFSGIFGAMVMTNIYVAVPPELFLDALRGYIDHTTVGSGLIKAPFMALIIGLIAAVEGLKVGGSAESLGQRVTASVVKGIFMVIVVDGFFAIFYAAIDY